MLGEEEFVERVKRRIKEIGSKREQPGVRQLGAKDAGEVPGEVARYLGVALELLYRHGGVSQAAIGKLMGGLDYTAASRKKNGCRNRLRRIKS